MYIFFIYLFSLFPAISSSSRRPFRRVCVCVCVCVFMVGGGAKDEEETTYGSVYAGTGSAASTGDAFNFNTINTRVPLSQPVLEHESALATLYHSRARFRFRPITLSARLTVAPCEFRRTSVNRSYVFPVHVRTGVVRFAILSITEIGVFFFRFAPNHSIISLMEGGSNVYFYNSPEGQLMVL
jgi:hypothetical protein